MNHNDHVALIRDGLASTSGIWADFGSGSGAFTLALADVLGEQAQIYSIDRDSGALDQQRSAMRARFPDRKRHLPDGGFHAQAGTAAARRRADGEFAAFRPAERPGTATDARLSESGRRLILVEYNVDHGNMWVPHPLSYPTWAQIASKNGFSDTRMLAAHPSRFLNEIYSAVSTRG